MLHTQNTQYAQTKTQPMLLPLRDPIPSLSHQKDDDRNGIWSQVVVFFEREMFKAPLGESE